MNDVFLLLETWSPRRYRKGSRLSLWFFSVVQTKTTKASTLYETGACDFQVYTREVH